MIPTSTRPDAASSGSALAGVGGLGLSSFLHAEGLLAADLGRPHFAPKAKRVIYLFMGGGPSHLDMLDPKPQIARFAGQRPDGVALRTERVTGGLLASPFGFEKAGESGADVSELMPHLKDRWINLCILRGVHGSNPNHGPATNFMLSGRIDQLHPVGRLVGLVRPRDGQPGPAWVRVAGQLLQRVAQRLLCPASTRGRRSTSTSRTPTR